MTARATRPIWGLLLALALAGCDGGVSGPPPDPTVRDQAAVVLAWNQALLDLLALHPWTPPGAARELALLSVAQDEALQGAAAAGLAGAAAALAENAALEAASAGVLRSLYPGEAPFLDLVAAAQRVDPWSDAAGAAAATGRVAGEAAAARMIERGGTDGAGAEWPGPLPAGPGIWFSSLDPPAPPLHPMAGSMRPWVLGSGAELDPGPPPEFGSPAFQAALAEVRAVSDARTAHQVEVARHWEYGPGTSSPAGTWNEIAADLIVAHGLTAREAARALVLLNVAMADAGIATWAAKYSYWLLRPSQADPAITMVVALPNFPAYPSGHSAFGGAAERILGALFPPDEAELVRMAEENAISRLYGGVHYTVDNTAGLTVGRAAAARVLAEWGVTPLTLASGRPVTP